MYTDARMISRTVAFASKVAKTAAPFRANLLAMEFGNEMNCCTDKAPTKDIIAWTHLIYAAFKQNAGASVLPWAPEFGGRKCVLRVRDWPSQNGVFGF